MTLITRAAALAALALGIVGFAGVSAPVNATQAAPGTITGDDGARALILPAIAVSTTVPDVDTAAAVTAPQADDRTDLDTADADAAQFQSLADAVAGQSAPGELSNEMRCLAGAIYYESKGEPLAGQLAVAEVIINRARSGRYPKSLCGVVTQAGQFSFVRGGVVPAINPALGQWKTAVAVAQVALEDAWESPAANAMFFHARYVSPSWSRARIASIGNHVFYR